MPIPGSRHLGYLVLMVDATDVKAHPTTASPRRLDLDLGAIPSGPGSVGITGSDR